MSTLSVQNKLRILKMTSEFMPCQSLDVY